ncbi:hypothetical protein JaAD80_17605 [Janthinobacterium sp. AD80]|nr:hypothetical protein JaAD80_17605 [Janthinobacterium sp. AD80]
MIGTNTSHLSCIAGLTVLAQLTATFGPDRPWRFGTHCTRNATAHFVTRIFRFGSRTCQMVPFFAFSAATNCTAASLISNKPWMSPRVRSSSRVPASAAEVPGTRKRAVTKEVYMRLFNRNGTHIFYDPCQVCLISDRDMEGSTFPVWHCHTRYRSLFDCWQDCLAQFDCPVYAFPRHRLNNHGSPMFSTDDWVLFVTP